MRNVESVVIRVCNPLGVHSPLAIGVVIGVLVAALILMVKLAAQFIGMPERSRDSSFSHCAPVIAGILASTSKSGDRIWGSCERTLSWPSSHPTKNSASSFRKLVQFREFSSRKPLDSGYRTYFCSCYVLLVPIVCLRSTRRTGRCSANEPPE